MIVNVKRETGHVFNYFKVDVSLASYTGESNLIGNFGSIGVFRVLVTCLKRMLVTEKLFGTSNAGING